MKVVFFVEVVTEVPFEACLSELPKPLVFRLVGVRESEVFIVDAGHGRRRSCATCFAKIVAAF